MITCILKYVHSKGDIDFNVNMPLNYIVWHVLNNELGRHIQTPENKLCI